MKKTLRFTFELLSHIVRKQAALYEGGEGLKRRTLRCETVGDKLVASYIDEGWTKDVDDVGHSSFPENSFWGIELEGLRFAHVSATYDNALMPSRLRDVMGCYKWINGEEHCWQTDKDKMHDVLVTCLPTPKTVCVSMDIGVCSNEELNLMRESFVEVTRKVERIIKLTKISLRLMRAFESKPQNEGRVRRFVNELMVSIGRI